MAIAYGSLLTLLAYTPAVEQQRSRKGQVRIIEVIIAVFMVVMVTLLVAFFTRPMRSPYLRETIDLCQLAHNLLSQLTDAGSLELIVADALSGDEAWEGRMRMLVSASLPVGIFFRIQIHEIRKLDNGSTVLERLDKGGITNLAPDMQLTESEVVYYTYTCVRGPDRLRGRILYIVVVIGYAS